MKSTGGQATAEGVEFEQLVDGVRCCGVHWPAPAQIPTIALHGWLDNAASFAPIAAHLPELDLWALDLPGHGHSDHRPAPGAYNIWDDLLEILAFADAKGWQRFNVLAHSRGAIMSVLLAATMPERVARMLLLDGIWPMPAEAADAPSLLRQYLLDQRGVTDRVLPSYSSLDAATKARQKATGMAYDAARLIVERGTRVRDDGRIAWRSDPRLTLASAFKLTAEHIQAFLAALDLPVKIILASEGFARYPDWERWLQHNPRIEWQTLQGKHHMHMDQPRQIARLVVDFFAARETD